MPAEAFLDPRFVALPGLLRSATKTDLSAPEVRRFMDALLEADAALFAGALLLRSREGRRFILVHETGGPVEDARSWLRWPLSRLFSTRRACLITNPRSGARALAIPFYVSDEWYAVVAPLRGPADSAQSVFLAALQSITAAPPPRSVAHGAPRFAWFGTDKALHARLRSAISARGWEFHAASTFGHLVLLLERDAIDVALIQPSSLGDAMHSLRTLRHAAKIGDAPILYFSDTDPESEIETLVDACLYPDAPTRELIKALKQSVSLVPQARAKALREAVRNVEDDLRACEDYADLARACANAALALGSDAASVMLADQTGAIHAAHVPEYQDALQDHWPAAFVTGEPVTDSTAGDRFFEEVFDDREYAKRLQALHALSGASLPIRDGPKIIGTLLAFSTARAMFDPEFSALADLAALTGRVFSARGNAGGRLWRRMTACDAHIDVYQGAKGHAALQVSTHGSLAAIAAVEDEDRARSAEFANALVREVTVLQERAEEQLRALVRRFDDGKRGVLVGIVDGERLTYACSRFPLPLRVPVSGPVPAIRRASECESGGIALGPQSVTLIYSNEFASQIETAQLVATVQRGLRGRWANAARSLPELALSRGRLAFAAITMPTYGVDSPHPQALF